MADYYSSGTVDYENGLPLAGALKSISLTAVIDEYYVGMPLTYNTTNDNYEYSETAIMAICIQETELTSEGSLLCAVSGTEFQESALVDGSNDAITITDDVRNAALLNGIILR